MTIPVVYLPLAPGKSIASSASKHFNDELGFALLVALTMPAGLILIQRRKFADSASAQRR